jgi:hypothetical protein
MLFVSFCWIVLVLLVALDSAYLRFVVDGEQRVGNEMDPNDVDHNSNATDSAYKPISQNELEKLVVLNISEDAKRVDCGMPLACRLKTFHGMKISPSSLVDYKRKILMEFSPKADCTSATVMFLAHMGYRYGLEFSGW